MESLHNGCTTPGGNSDKQSTFTSCNVLGPRIPGSPSICDEEEFFLLCFYFLFCSLFLFVFINFLFYVYLHSFFLFYEKISIFSYTCTLVSLIRLMACIIPASKLSRLGINFLFRFNFVLLLNIFKYFPQVTLVTMFMIFTVTLK